MWALWIPLVTAWMALPWLAAARSHGALAIAPMWRDGWPLALRAAAALGGAICLALTIRCWKRMGARWKMAVTPASAPSSSPMARRARPPPDLRLQHRADAVYAGGGADAADAARRGAARLPHAGQGRNEERHLLAEHGEAYARYVARTGRFFPRFASSGE